MILVGAAVFLWVRPLDDMPFKEMTDQEIIALVNDDLYRSVTAMDYLETTGNDVLALLYEGATDNNSTEDISKAFDEFLLAVAYSESLTETHRYFGTLPYRLWNERLNSFLISYSLYAKKYELVHRMIAATAGNEHNKKALNQYKVDIGRDGVYTEMASRFYEPKTRVRLSGGFLYSRLFIGDTPKEDISFSLLRDKSYQSYAYLVNNFNQTLQYAPEVVTDNVEKSMFEAWMPVQKGVATAMGRAIISTRGKAGLIQPSDALVMEKSMLPGDIMLQRRNWHVSNVGIPGFWTHSALYTGSLETMEEYFSSEFPYEGYESLAAYMIAVTPAAYEVYVANTGEEFSYSVIEAIEPGVVMQTLPTSASADFVAVLRPNLSKRDVLQALLKAFANTGKPYDFNFDFDTRDALVCSELVYDAYFERLPDKAGLHMNTSIINGRKIVSPFDIAQKYVDERGGSAAQLKFVYFLASSENTGQVYVAVESDFIDSMNWSKFSFLQEQVYLNQ